MFRYSCLWYNQKRRTFLSCESGIQFSDVLTWVSLVISVMHDEGGGMVYPRKSLTKARIERDSLKKAWPKTHWGTVVLLKRTQPGGGATWARQRHRTTSTAAYLKVLVGKINIVTPAAARLEVLVGQKLTHRTKPKPAHPPRSVRRTTPPEARIH